MKVALSGVYTNGLFIGFDAHTTPTAGTTGPGSLTTAWLEEVGLPRLRAAFNGTAISEGHATNNEPQGNPPKRKKDRRGGKKGQSARLSRAREDEARKSHALL